jgi:hypothetical protein
MSFFFFKCAFSFCCCNYVRSVCSLKRKQLLFTAKKPAQNQTTCTHIGFTATLSSLNNTELLQIQFLGFITIGLLHIYILYLVK